MLKKISLFILFALIFSGPTFSEIFKVSYINPKTKLIKAYNKDDGKYLWQSITKVQTVEVNGKMMLKITEDCRGLWGNKNERTWRAENYYIYSGVVAIPDRSSITFYDSKGNVVEKQGKKYSRDDKKVYCLRNEEKKEFDYEGDLIDKELLGTCLMNYPYGRKEDFEFHMMTNEPAHYKMTMVNKGTEILTVNGATIECYKLQMIPDLGFLGIFAPFVPKTYFWYKMTLPHEFVRYEGLESGLNTPYIVMEASD
jgi:hypothetical protein